MGPGEDVRLPYITPAELSRIDGELGAADVQDILGNYLDEPGMAVWNLLLDNPGLTGGEPVEVMDIDPQTIPAAEIQDQIPLLRYEPVDLIYQNPTHQNTTLVSD